MTTLSKVSVTRAWTLVYDAATSGSFTGAVCSIERDDVAYRVASALPSDTDPGMTANLWLTISLSQTKGDKLYAKSTDDSAQILLDSSMGAEANDKDLSGKLGSTVDILNQISTAEYTPIVGQKPLPGLSLLRDLKVGGDTEFSVVGGEIRIDGGLGLRSLYTTDYGLYVPGLLGIGGLRTRMETPNSGTYRYGYGNDDGNRVGIENVDGAYSTFIESGGVRWYSKPRAEWLDPLDGAGPSGINADINGATLRIVLGWYGGISILFTILISDRVNGDRLVTVDSSGPRANGVTLEQPDLPIFAEANGGVMYVGGRQYGVLGRFTPQYRVTSNRAVTKAINDTTPVPLFSMQVKSATRWKSVPISLEGETVISTVNAEYYFIINGALDTSAFAGFDGIDSEETALQIDTTATSVTGGYRAPGGISTSSGNNKAGAPVSTIPDVNIPAGSIITMMGISLGGAGTMTGIMRMRELW